MKYRVYKCNSNATPYARDIGDWDYVFEQPKGCIWGLFEDFPELKELTPGTLLIAQQSNKKELVGVAEVVGVGGTGQNSGLWVRPLERIGVKIPPLKKANPRIGAITALQGGPIKTIYEISDEYMTDGLCVQKCQRESKFYLGIIWNGAGSGSRRAVVNKHGADRPASGIDEHQLMRVLMPNARMLTLMPSAGADAEC